MQSGPIFQPWGHLGFSHDAIKRHVGVLMDMNWLLISVSQYLVPGKQTHILNCLDLRRWKLGWGEGTAHFMYFLQTISNEFRNIIFVRHRINVQRIWAPPVHSTCWMSNSSRLGTMIRMKEGTSEKLFDRTFIKILQSASLPHSSRAPIIKTMGPPDHSTELSALADSKCSNWSIPAILLLFVATPRLNHRNEYRTWQVDMQAFWSKLQSSFAVYHGWKKSSQAVELTHNLCDRSGQSTLSRAG